MEEELLLVDPDDECAPAVSGARLSRSHPTLEVRVADVCLHCHDAVLLVGLTRALVDAVSVMEQDGSVMLDRRSAAGGGEICLRRAGGHYEIISNGTFLMDTRSGDSERLLVRAGLERLAAPRRALIGGLGIGFSLREALASTLEEIIVVELEQAVVDWHGRWLGQFSGNGLENSRVRLEVCDVQDLLKRWEDNSLDLISIDVDNGPGWLVRRGNSGIYDVDGLRNIARCLRDGGILSVWSSFPEWKFERSLRQTFYEVSILDVDVKIGGPDIVYLATHPIVTA